MTKPQTTAIVAMDAAPRTVRSNYPPLYAARMEGRSKRPLGDLFGLQNFGVNLTTLDPGASSSLMHRHSEQDEFVYVVHGRPTLRVGDREVELSPGMCAGFPKKGQAHVLVNRSSEPCAYLEVGDRSKGDTVEYPEDDLRGELGADGRWVFSHKDGRPFERDGVV